jgi:enamine deaminase RidA (YjgF/YER057c/UK114 family)
MTRRLITTGSPFEGAYGYSRAVVDGEFVFVAGTTGYDYVSMAMPADVAEQTRNIFRTIEAVLAEAGSSLADVVRAQYFVTDRAHCLPVLAVCGEVFRNVRPAAGTYVVSGLLQPEMEVEIEVTAKRRPSSEPSTPSAGNIPSGQDSGQGGSA